MPSVLAGLEKLLESPSKRLRKARLGLLCNPASVDSRLRHAVEGIRKAFSGNPVLLFSPQHGFYAEKQDNMIESEDTRDSDFGIPVFSLYGRHRSPPLEVMDRIDVLLVDLQDVGCRVYTFIYTLSYCMEAAAALGKAVIVLDRPNPAGGECVEGNFLSPECASFVGRFPIPMRHGLTIGETARLFNDHFGIGCNLSVIPMENWERSMYFEDTGLPWIPPSPNLPVPDSAIVYPGQVLWEGTNVSEGRGTTRPFEIFGAPFLDPRAMLDFLGGNALPGVHLRPLAFEPTWNKWQGVLCRGFQLHVTDRTAFRPYTVSLKLLEAVLRVHPRDFRWKEPPYEYEFRRLPIDLILGDSKIREHLELGGSADTLLSAWIVEEERFRRLRKPFCLYPERTPDTLPQHP